MKADPEQRAVQLGEYIAAHNGPRCGQRRLRSGAASPPCTRTLPCGCARMQPGAVPAGACRAGAATRPSGTCGAGRPPGANTAAAKPQKDRCIVQRSFLSHFFMEGAAKSGCFYPAVWNWLQCAFFQPAYLCLTDADLLRHLHLGLALQVAQLHDPLFPRASARPPSAGTAAR